MVNYSGHLLAQKEREWITYLLQHFRTKELRSICNKRNTHDLIKKVVLKFGSNKLLL